MEKIIIADGKKIKLKTNGLVPLIYKKEFKRDFFADVQYLISQENDIEILYNLVWTFARVADECIEELNTWLASFDSFPIHRYMPDILSLVTACLSTGEKETKKTKATVK